MSDGSSYQPYVEDYDSVISEVVPLTRRTTTREKSGLSNSQSADSNYDGGVSDSGYSSHTNTPNNETPPLKSTTPAPLPPINTRQESLRRSKTPGMGRPSSKSFSRTQSPAVPRNIPNAKPRERSGTVDSNATTEDCECSDCKKGGKPSPSSSSPSMLSNGAAWPLHSSYHSGSYGQSPSWGGSYHYPTRDPYESGVTADYSRPTEKKRERASMPPPPRPSSTFSGTTASSYSTGFGGSYFGHAPSPAPQPPTPVSTCPPTYSAYAPPPPPPMDHVPSPVHGSPYGPPPSSIPSYGQSYGYDAWGRSTTPITPSSSYPAATDYTSMPPPPPINRRNSMRAQANARAAIEDFADEYQRPSHPARRPSRVSSGERPPSWTSSQFSEGLGHSRSYSVPPVESASMSERRKMTTPGPAPRRRESGHSSSSRPEIHPSRLGPSALSRAMESCAIDDDHHAHPPTRSQSRSHYDSHHHERQLSRRDPGTMMHPTHSDSGSSGSGRSHDKEELVQMTVPDTEGESFTMRYPAGIPVKLQVNGGPTQRIYSRGSKEKDENVELNVAYRYVQQRQQQVHAQLQYGAMEHGGRRTSGEYTYRTTGGYNRRATLNGM